VIGVDPAVLVLVKVTFTLPPTVAAITVNVPGELTVDTPGDDMVKPTVGPVTGAVVLTSTVPVAGLLLPFESVTLSVMVLVLGVVKVEEHVAVVHIWTPLLFHT
jgi:hypothetical protein